jgi:membrane-bound serine protease (ClpP class)
VIENKLKIKDYRIVEFKPSFYDGLKGFLMNPMFQGILILVIMGGIYFELQTPGVGFPLLAAGIAAILYFSPLYIDGIAENWEILLFIIGVVLIGLEVFVIPGFGIAGISGITLVITGLTLSMLHNDAFDFSGVSFDDFFQALATVMTGFVISVGLGIYLSDKLFSKGPFAKVALQTTEQVDEGYIGVENSLKDLVGRTGIAYTVLRPAGKIEIDEDQYDAVAETGYIEKNEEVEVVRFAHGQLYVKKKG